MRRLLRDAAAMEILTHAIIHNHLPVTVPGDRTLTTLSTSVHSQNLKANWTYPLKQGWISILMQPKSHWTSMRTPIYFIFFWAQGPHFPMSLLPFSHPYATSCRRDASPKVQIHLEHLGSVESISLTRTSKQTANAFVFWKKNKKNIQATAYITYIFT